MSGVYKKDIQMKVKDLIELLSKLPEDMLVLHGDHDEWYYESDEPRVSWIAEGRELDDELIGEENDFAEKCVLIPTSGH